MSKHRLTLLVALVAALAAVLAATGAAGACAQDPDDPCLHDPDRTFVSGQVWVDRDGDGGPRAGDDPAAAQLRVYLDVNGNQHRDRGEPASGLDDAGRYELEVDVNDTDGRPEASKIRLDLSHWSEVHCTRPVPCSHEEPFVRGVPQRGKDFAISYPATIRGEVAEDHNENDRRDRGERGAINARVYLDLDRDGARGPGEPYDGVDQYGTYDIRVPHTLLGRELPLRIETIQGMACSYPSPCETTVPPLAARQYHDVPRWMVTMPVIVFVHGFLGSKIHCGPIELWVGAGKPFRADPDNMRLSPDGTRGLQTLEGGSPCSAAAKPNGELVMDVFGADIYGSSVEHYKSLARAERFRAIAWDWRKDPMSQVDELDKVVDEARCGSWTNCDPGHAEKVVLVAHSQGGLLSRAYIADPERARKVRRLVTVGTPTWGSPKPVFPIVAGVEAITASPMDALLPDVATKRLYANLPGGFALLPSPRYGPWLTVPTWDPLPMDADSAPDFFDAVGANEALIRRQVDHHRNLWDHYGRLNGVEYEVVVGRGVPTVQRVRLEYGITERVELTFGEGDQTVPEKSAAFDAPADKRHYVCGVGHVPLTADAQTTQMVDDFVQHGGPVKPNRTHPTCAATGTVIEAYNATARAIDLTDHEPRATASQAGGGMSVAEARQRGLVEVIGFGAQQFIVTQDRKPVTLSLPAGTSITTREVHGDRESGFRSYPPQAEPVTISTGAATKVTSGGRALRPAAKRDAKPPRTTAKVQRLRGGKVRVALRARDASKVAAVYLVRKGRKVRYRRPVVLSAAVAKRTTYGAVDAWGNAEKPRRLRVR